MSWLNMAWSMAQLVGHILAGLQEDQVCWLAGPVWLELAGLLWF